MISAAVGRGGETMISAQTVEAFWNAVKHVKPISVGLNCSLGPDLMRPFLAGTVGEVSAAHFVLSERGLPNPLSPTGFDLEPPHMARFLGEFAQSGLLNIAGGCCGNTPEHIAAIARALADKPPRPERAASENCGPASPRPLQLSGSQPFTQQIGSVPDDRRAHERHRVAEVREADQGGQVRGSRRRSRASRSRTARTSSTSTWTRG